MFNFWRILRFFLLTVFIILIQFSFINSVGGFLSNFNLVLYFLIYAFIVYDFKTAFWITFLVGFVFDILSFYAFGIHSLSLVLTLFAVNFLSINFFTNRSLYSFWAVSVFFVLFYNIILYFLISLINLFVVNVTLVGDGFFMAALKDLFFILIIVTVSFYFFDFDKERK
ncbi:MAG: hypothetical protein WC280_03325 [Patescibacteria group bacterium]